MFCTEYSFDNDSSVLESSLILESNFTKLEFYSGEAKKLIRAKTQIKIKNS